MVLLIPQFNASASNIAAGDIAFGAWQCVQTNPTTMYQHIDLWRLGPGASSLEKKAHYSLNLDEHNADSVQFGFAQDCLILVMNKNLTEANPCVDGQVVVWRYKSNEVLMEVSLGGFVGSPWVSLFVFHHKTN